MARTLVLYHLLEAARRYISAGTNGEGGDAAHAIHEGRTMSATPLTEAIEKLRAAVYTALSPLAAPHGVYWLQADQNAALPFVIAQSQDAGGRDVKHLGDYAWEGLVTIKALANGQSGNLSGAEALLRAVLPGMNSLAVSGYTFFVEHERPLVLPPDDQGVWQACSIFRVGIYKP
jgi:hypothetical protein